MIAGEAPPAEELLGDPELWRQLRTVAAIRRRGREWLRADLESACGLAVAMALRHWRPERGSSFRSFAVKLAHQYCGRAIQLDRPLGRRGDPTARPMGSLDDVAEAWGVQVGDLAEDPGEPADVVVERRELAERALELAGDDAPFLEAVARGELLREAGKRLGVSGEWVRRRAERGLERVRARLADLA